MLQQAEYVDPYIMEPMAERMPAENPALRAKFEKWLGEGPIPSERLFDERR